MLVPGETVLFHEQHSVPFCASLKTTGALTCVGKRVQHHLYEGGRWGKWGAVPAAFCYKAEIYLFHQSERFLQILL